jgi:hypothetical protein
VLRCCCDCGLLRHASASWLLSSLTLCCRRDSGRCTSSHTRCTKAQPMYGHDCRCSCCSRIAVRARLVALLVTSGCLFFFHACLFFSCCGCRRRPTAIQRTWDRRLTARSRSRCRALPLRTNPLGNTHTSILCVVLAVADRGCRHACSDSKSAAASGAATETKTQVTSRLTVTQ